MQLVKRLDVFGDSWPAGGELQDQDQYRFPDLMGLYLNLDINNHAVSATSMDQAVYAFLKQYRHWEIGQTIVLFCITDYARGLCFDQGQTQELHPTRRDHLPSTAYYKHIYSEELGQFNQLRNILLVQGLCRKKQLPVFFVCNWTPVHDDELINKQNFYLQSLFEILGLQNPGSEITCKDTSNQLQNCKYIHPNKGHPNIAGHQLIADKLSIWIKEKLYDKSVS